MLDPNGSEKKRVCNPKFYIALILSSILPSATAIGDGSTSRLGPIVDGPYPHQVVLTLGDQSQFPHDLDAIKASAMKKGIITTRVIDLTKPLTLTDKRYLAEITGKSRVYVIGHGSPGGQIITSDPLRGRNIPGVKYIVRGDSKFVGFKSSDISKLLKENAPQINSGGKVKVSLLACNGGSDLVTSRGVGKSFGARLSQDLYQNGIKAEVNARTGGVSRTTPRYPQRMVQMPGQAGEMRFSRHEYGSKVTFETTADGTRSTIVDYSKNAPNGIERNIAGTDRVRAELKVKHQNERLKLESMRENAPPGEYRRAQDRLHKTHLEEMNKHNSSAQSVGADSNSSAQKLADPPAQKAKKFVAPRAPQKDATAGTLKGAEAQSKPTTANPTTANPTTANPTTANPTTAKPTAANPTTTNPTTANPTTANPSDAGDITPSTKRGSGANSSVADVADDVPIKAKNGTEVGGAKEGAKQGASKEGSYALSCAMAAYMTYSAIQRDKAFIQNLTAHKGSCHKVRSFAISAGVAVKSKEVSSKVAFTHSTQISAEESPSGARTLGATGAMQGSSSSNLAAFSGSEFYLPSRQALHEAAIGIDQAGSSRGVDVALLHQMGGSVQGFLNQVPHPEGMLAKLASAGGVTSTLGDIIPNTAGPIKQMLLEFAQDAEQNPEKYAGLGNLSSGPSPAWNGHGGSSEKASPQKSDQLFHALFKPNLSSRELSSATQANTPSRLEIDIWHADTKFTIFRIVSDRISINAYQQNIK